MKKQIWIILVLILILAIFFFRGKEQYSPEGCKEYLLDSNVAPQTIIGRHTIQLESEQRDLAIINIDKNRELFREYSPNYYDFGKIRISFYGPQDNRVTVEVCTFE